MVRTQAWRLHPDHRLAVRLIDEPQRVQLHGVVIDDPAERSDLHGGTYRTCVMRLLHLRNPDAWRPIAGRVRVMWHAPVRLRYGEEVAIEGRWSRVPAAGNPGQYDARQALARERIHGLLRVGPADGVAVIGDRRRCGWLSVIFSLRHRWERAVRAAMGERTAGLLLSAVLGQRAALDEELEEAFVETGTVHLLVVSGFNVALIAGLLEWLLRLAGLPGRMRLILIALGLGGYCLLTGMQPPVMRATVMGWIVLGALALDRVISWPNALATAGLVLLTANPMQLFDPGFQLSFGAVASLLAFAARWGAWLEQRARLIRPDWLRRYLAFGLASTGAIWIGLWPALAWYFFLLSPVSPLANLLIAPLFSLLVSAGTAVLLLGTVCDAFVRCSAGMLTLLADSTMTLVRWCHALPGGHLWVSRPSPWLMAGYYGLLILSVAGARAGVRRRWLMAGWTMALTAWLGSLLIGRQLESRWLTVDALDVGHGDCLLVRLPQGQAMLVDAGSEEAGRFRVVPFLRAIGVTTLDALILTHPDADHLGGAPYVIDQVRVKRLLTNGAWDDTMAARTVRHLAAARRIPQQLLRAGQQLGGGAGTEMLVLHPPEGLVPGVAPGSNDNSVVVKLTKGSVSFLLTGDLEEAGLPWLLRQGGRLPATVLKVPHHGSRLGPFGAEFFAAVHPALAILSVGRLHRLPAPETVAAITRTGAALYSTRETGAIRMRTDGTRLEVDTFR